MASVVLLAACSGNNVDIVEADTGTATATGNINNGPVQAVASSSTNPNAAALVRIEQGTTLINGNGQTVDGSNVKVTVEAFDGSASSQDKVTGTTEFTDQPVAAALADLFGKSLDTSEDVVITVASFARVNVEAEGQAIKQFSPAITIRIKTGLAQGRTVGVVSIDETTGERLFEGAASVGGNGNVVIQTDHLTDVVVVSNITGTASGSGGSTQ